LNNIYADLEFPPPVDDRPYTYINMVATIDGKTVSGDRGDNVVDLGSKVDHELMDRIEAASDAIILGAQTLRATSPNWNPRAPIRIVVTRSGDIPIEAKYFSAPEAQPYVACPANAVIELPENVQRIRAGKDHVDLGWLAKYLRRELAIERLHVLGGSELNSQFLKANLVDELFLTIAPKIKLGRELPTYAGGEPLPKGALLQFNLIEHHVVEDEVFLRYRRRPK